MQQRKKARGPKLACSVERRKEVQDDCNRAWDKICDRSNENQPGKKCAW